MQVDKSLHKRWDGIIRITYRERKRALLKNKKKGYEQRVVIKKLAATSYSLEEPYSIKDN